MNDRSGLFCDNDLFGALRARELSLREQVDGLAAEQILSLSEDQLVEHLVAQMRIEPLALHEDEKELDPRETKIDVSGDPRRAIFPGHGPVQVAAHEVRVLIPFTGEPDLWRLRPSTYQSMVPHGRVEPPSHGKRGTLVVTVTQPADLPAEQIKAEVDGTLQRLRFYLANQKPQVEAFNAALPNHFRQHIRARKARLEAQKGIQKMLGIPLKRREGVPSVEPIHLTRQLVRPLPSVPKGGFSPEPGIAEEDYLHILSVIRHEGRTFETIPKTCAKLDEEELRDILRAHLNGHYKGLATGETFRGSGKTDICIEVENRAAFIAECKLWRGAAELTSAIDQLLRYLTWRDCKTSLVVFNKQNAKFSELLEKIPATIQAHPAFRRSGMSAGPGEWRFTLAAPGDAGREIGVHVFVFNLFV